MSLTKIEHKENVGEISQERGSDEREEALIHLMATSSNYFMLS